MTNFSTNGGSASGGQKLSYFLLRLGMGVLFAYAGWVKIIDPKWTAAGYITGSKTFTGFYSWLLQPEILPVINFLNKWFSAYWNCPAFGHFCSLGIGFRLCPDDTLLSTNLSAASRVG